MADGEQSDKENKNTSSPQRRPYHHYRGASFYRGRGRGNDPSVNKALHLFGVRDLREILNKKHQDQEQATSGPPPDPSYNYLKDPAREGTSEQPTHRYHKEYPESRGHFSRGSRGYNRGGQTRENRHPESGNRKHSELTREASYIQNPVNIKVEVFATTGERSCKIDEETKLGDIKHVPNYTLKDLRPPRTEGIRGRGGGSERFDSRGRGRGQRGGRRGFRGSRGDRGGGRGQGRYFSPRNREQSSDQLHPQSQPQQETPELQSEENWDPECANVPNKENEGEKHDEEEYVEGQEDHQEYDEEIEVGANAEPNELEDLNDSGINIEENLVVTSSNSEEKHKRSVTFKVEEQINEATAKDVKENNEKDSEQENPKNETDETQKTANGDK